jgi:hypothetical protein
VRGATLTFFRALPPDTWSRRGVASDNAFTVRALAYRRGPSVSPRTDFAGAVRVLVTSVPQIAPPAHS